LLRELGITVPAADQLAAELDHQFGHLYRWLDHNQAADDLARRDITDPVLLAACQDCGACGEFDRTSSASAACMPPRTGALIHARADNYCDMIHDLAEEIPSAIPLEPHDDLWPIPETAWWMQITGATLFAANSSAQRAQTFTSLRPGV
jgi:hypothetical protein